MKKKILPIFISLVMLFSLFPLSIFAAEAEAVSSESLSQSEALSEAQNIEDAEVDADTSTMPENEPKEETEEPVEEAESEAHPSEKPVEDNTPYFDEELWPEIIDGGQVTIGLPQNGRARMSAQSTGQLTLRRHEAIRWNFNKTGGNVDERPWYLVDIDGTVAYCVEPGNPNTVSGTYGTISYDALTTDQKYAIGYAMLYGAQNTNDPLYHMATQVVIWEIVYGYLDLNTLQPTGSIPYNNTIGYNDYNRQADVNYPQILNDMRNHKQVPSFMGSVENSMPTQTLPGGTGNFDVTLTNTNPNARLADFNFTNTDGLTFTKNGEQLTIRSTGEMAGYAIAAYKGSSGYTDSLIYWGSGDNQVRATAGALTPVPAYMRLSTKTQYASLELLKVDAQTGKPIAGVEFELFLNGRALGKYTTDGNGKILVDSLPAGKLTAVETGPAPGYIPSDAVHEATLEWGKTATITVANTKMAGLQLQKVDAKSGLPMEGVCFAIYDAEGKLMGEYTTDNQGLITLEDSFMPGEYTLCETATLPGYILDSTPHAVTLVAGEMASVTISNTKLAGL